MKIFVFIASFAVLGCIAVEGFGHRHHHNHHPFFRPLFGFEHEQHGFHRPPQGPYPNHMHHTHIHEHDEANSKPDYNHYESWDKERWHNSRHHHCNGWRCPPRTWKQESTNTPKPTTTTPNKTDETRTTTSSPSSAPSPTTHSQTQSPSTIKGQSPTDTTLPSSRPTTKSTWYPSNEQTTRLPTTTSSLGTTTENIVSKCLDDCLSTPEYNPVCGTNGETYNNIGKLNCAKSCGINVDLRRTSACPPPNIDDKGDRSNTTPPTLMTTAATSTSASVRGINLKTYQNCLKQCPLSYGHSPVCGTDHETYMNIDRLKCAISCGKDVQFLCDRPCAVCLETVKTTSTTSSTSRSTTVEDKVTSTPSTQSRENLPTPPQTTRTPSSTTSQQLTDTTIPNDILQGVFNFSTSTQPTIAIPKNDSGYEFPMDPRFGNK